MTQNKKILKPMMLLFLLMISLSVAGQVLDQDCRPLVPSQCHQIAAELEERQDYFHREINRLTEQPVRNETERKRVTDRINALKRQRDAELARLRNELQQCQQQHSNPASRRQEAPSTLNALFVGRVTANTTNGNAPGPFNFNMTLGIQFSRNRCVVTITNFPPLVSMPYNTPLGRGTTTTTLSSGGIGRFFPVSGQVSMPVTLLLNHSIVFAGDDTADMTFTTGNSVSARGAFNLNGVPLSLPNGASLESCGITIQCPITLVGTTVFRDGFLGGSEGGFTMQGNITIPQSSPPQPPPSSVREKCLERCQTNYEICQGQRVEPGENLPNCQAIREACRRRCPPN